MYIDVLLLLPVPSSKTTDAAVETNVSVPSSSSQSRDATPSTSTSATDIKAEPIDPADWPVLSDKVRTELVLRGPYRIQQSFTFPKEPGDDRRCQHSYFQRQLINGEKVRRSWLTYSKKKDCVYCFCCKLFSKKTINLNTEGFNDWHNATKSLGEHERSADHNTNMASWRELEVRLAQGTTIDRQEMALAEAERNRWRQVLTRLVAIIQSLAERNLAFRGHTEKLNTPGNGNFLKEVELMAKFDPVMMQHVSRVERETGKHTLFRP